jgi:putative peptide zinc metalloprotease protein
MATTAPAPANELERRKQVKIRIRTDLGIEAQKYEGRTYYVVKDPVSMRYYRLKDHEYFLVRYMDGNNTLDDAQKAYETRYRPDRLKLEELEGFAQQLLTAGLAHNESPKAGKQLFDRRKKRLRSEWMQTLTNILYIKIPIFDPDRLLTVMVKYFRFIFTMWFFLLSVGVMAAALLLVGTHFEAFRSKLPNYHEFFSLKTVAYLWVALGCVKVIHEFGHGLSCKRFGGEVHEMGGLLLCFSPALYCNVSDAWTLPNKWHRIIISAAGIYVELIIAAISTFVWWNSATHPFVNNMALSLMVVCSVSTVVFNANPLMRYDGYYVLADLLEIPNLRERANRYLTNVFLEYALGVEVQPEEYMALWRRILFIVFAVVSYVYRWVVTFTILFFFNNFLKPYKLEIVGQMLTFASLGSMLGWPLYRLGKNIHRRGRLPDMKRWRVTATVCVAAAIIVFACFVPVPIGRIRSPGLVEPKLDAHTPVYVHYSGRLEKLNFSAGDYVQKGDELAVFSNVELEQRLADAKTELKVAETELELMKNNHENIPDPKAINERASQIQQKTAELNGPKEKVRELEAIKSVLILRAPVSGIIGSAPDANDLHKWYELLQEPTPFCTINEPRQFRVCVPMSPSELHRLIETMTPESEAARETLHNLRKNTGPDKTTVTVDYYKVPLSEVLSDLTRQTKSVHFEIDPNNKQLPSVSITYSSPKDQPLGDALQHMFGEAGLGYVILSDPNSDEDGCILVRSGRERGTIERRGLTPLSVVLRIQGREWETWQGKVSYLPQSEAKEIPLQLSNKAGGPVPVKAERSKNGALIPQTQYYLVYVDIENADDAISPGTMAQVKIKTKNETCLKWMWRTINNSMELKLM